MPAPFAFDRTFELPVPPAELFTVLGRTDDFTRWWDWLRQCDCDGLRAGSVARCVVQAPLPYSLRFAITIMEVDAPRLLATRVEGDLRGEARLDVAPGAHGSSARLGWSLELGNSWLRRLSLVARPAMTWAHDRIVEAGLTQFEQHALRTVSD